MYSAKSRFRVRLAANLALAVGFLAIAVSLAVSARTLSLSSDILSRAKRTGFASDEEDRTQMNILLDKALANSRAKDALLMQLFYLLIAAYFILLVASIRNMYLAFNLDNSKHTLLHHFASAFAKIFRSTTLALRGEVPKDGALVDAKSISGVQIDYIERQRVFAHEFDGYDSGSMTAFNLTIAAWEIFRGRQDETPNLELRAEIPDEDIIVRAHEELVGCIIDNLLGNATKYTDSGSVTLSLSRQGRNVRIVVADTGRGISKDMQKRMYKPHVRDDAALDKDGSGWGLYEVKCAVKKYGGRIQCRSELGKGTEFSVTLPIAVCISSSKANVMKDNYSSKAMSTPPPRKITQNTYFKINTYKYAA